jgi:hypothetical protein
MHNMLDSQRDTAFDERDGAASEKHNAGKGSPEYTEACERHSDAIEKIDDMNSRMKFHSKSMVELARNADSPGLEIVYDYTEEPPAPPKGAKSKKDDDKDQLKIQPEAPVAEGEDQQLNADPSELDLSGPLLAKLRKANISTINQLVKLQDAGGGKLRDDLDLSNAHAATLEESLEKFRKKHRRAIAEAEKEGAAPKR